MKVYKNGIEFYEIKDYKQIGRFMEVAYIDCTIESSYPINFEIGDYVIFDYNGLKYSLYDIPTIKKQARKDTYRKAFVYELKFKADTQQLVICPFLDIVENDNNIHYTSLPTFSTFENVYGIAKRIQANIDEFYPGQWKINVVDTDDAELLDVLSDARDFSVGAEESCFDGCKKVYDTWGVSFLHTVEDGINVITFGKSGDTTSKFLYGKGQGLRAFKRNVQNTDELCTRLYAYGSTRNIPTRWYNDKGYINDSQYAPNLMLPPDKWVNGNPQGAYIDAIIEERFGDVILVDDRVAKYGLRPKFFYYDGSDGREDIYPSIEKLTAKNIRDAKSDLNDTNYIPSTELYPDDERMDYILEGSSIEDNGISIESNYVLYSEKVNLTLDDEFTELKLSTFYPDSVGNYNLYNIDRLYYLCRMHITKAAKYRIDEVPNFFYIRKNDYHSIITIEYFINTPLDNEITLYKKTFSADDAINFIEFPQVYISCETIGTYDLYARVYVQWPEDLSNIKPIPPGDLMAMVGYDNIFAFHYGPVDTGAILILSRGESIITPYFNIKIKQIGFDIEDFTATSGKNKSISMISGMCGGRTFEIEECKRSIDDDSWILRCRRSDDSELSQRFPNSIFPISKDDEFVIININMPDLYVYTAMYRLYDAAYRDMLYYSNPQYLIEPEIDNFQIARSSQLLREGMYMPIEDKDLLLYKNILIDSVTITNKGTELRQFEVTLRNEKPLSRLSKLYERVSNIENYNSDSNQESNRTPAQDHLTEHQDISGLLSKVDAAATYATIESVKTNQSAVDAIKDWFTLRTLSDGTQVLHTRYNLATDGEMSVGGVSDDMGGDSNASILEINERLNALESSLMWEIYK